MSISLEAISSIGSLVSGLAVLASLAYLSLQVKQAEKNQQAIIQQARSTRNAEFNIAIAESNQLTDAFLKAFSAESLTMEEWFRFNSVSGSYFQHAEDSYYQHKHGLLPEDAYHGFENTLRVVVARPCTRVAWKIVRARLTSILLNSSTTSSQRLRLRRPLVRVSWRSGRAIWRTNWPIFLRPAVNVRRLAL